MTTRSALVCGIILAAGCARKDAPTPSLQPRDVPLPFTGVVGTGGALVERSRERKKRLAAALQWLADAQEQDGRWDADRHGGTRADTFCTGLAVRAFQAHANYGDRGRHKENVGRALRWVMAQQPEEGRIGGDGDDVRGHAVCGAALCEEYCVRRSEPTRIAATKALAYSCRLQRADGGWARSADAEPSLAAAQWFIIQLKLAQVAGLDVPEGSLRSARHFLDVVTCVDAPATGMCSNTPGGPMMPESTAAGLLCRQILGWKRTDPTVIAAAGYLTGRPPAWADAQTDYTFWYFGIQAAFQTGGEYWKAWDGALRSMLADHASVEGPYAGSWAPAGADCVAGGRVEATALALMSVGFYRAYLPPPDK